MCFTLLAFAGMCGQTTSDDSYLDMIGEVVQRHRNKLRSWINRVEFKIQEKNVGNLTIFFAGRTSLQAMFQAESTDEFVEALLHTFLGPLIERILRENSFHWILGRKV